MSAFHREKVLSVRHWTDTLFSFTATRDPGFRFLSGQFAMIGLEVKGRPLLRAYSMASANYEGELEFFSIKVAGRAADLSAPASPTGRHRACRPQADRDSGTDNLLPGQRLYSSTGTGLAPFSSVIKDPDVYDLYDNLILIHGCRQVAELKYGLDIVAERASENEFFGEGSVQEKLIHYPTVTREPFVNQGRITES